MKKILKKIKQYKKTMFILLLIFVFLIIFLSTEEPVEEESINEISLEEDTYCNVIGVDIKGDIYTYISEEDSDIVSSEDVVWQIDNANRDDDIKYILVTVDSYGGEPVAGEEIANAIKRSNKPVVSVIRSAADSAAYWAISASDLIYASKNSDVGSIGVTMSYLDYSPQNEDNGFNYNKLSTGKFKDAGDPDKPLTQEERDLFMRDLKIIHQNFIEDVSENRSIPILEVEAIADGSAVLGERSIELGLIDEIGDVYSAKKYISNLIRQEISVCEY